MSPYQILMVASLVQREAKPAGLRQGGPGHLQPAAALTSKLEFDSTVNYSLDRQEVATTDADRAQATPWNTYAHRGLAGHADLLARVRTRWPPPSVPNRATGCTSSRSTCRARRCSPGTTSSTWPISSWPSATVSSTARGETAREGRRSWVRRSRIPSHRSCTWPPTARWACTTGPTSASSARAERIARRGRRFRAGVGRRVGDDARQVRRAAVRRRAHRARANWSVRPTPWCAPRPAGAPTTPTSTGSPARSGTASGPRSCAGPAAPHRRPSWGWPNSASPTSPSSPAIRDKAARLVDLGARLAVATPVLRPRQRRAGRPRWPPPRCWSARSRPTSPPVRRQRSPRSPVLLDAIYDPWPTPLAAAVAAAGGRVISGAADAAAPGLRTGRAIHRAARSARGDGALWRRCG